MSPSCKLHRWAKQQTNSDVRALADGQTDRWTDRRYQVHYLPASLSYVVDNEGTSDQGH